MSRSIRSRPRAGAGVTALFIGGLAVSAFAAGFVGTRAQGPATAEPAAAVIDAHLDAASPSTDPISAERRS